MAQVPVLPPVEDVLAPPPLVEQQPVLQDPPVADLEVNTVILFVYSYCFLTPTHIADPIPIL